MYPPKFSKTALSAPAPNTNSVLLLRFASIAASEASGVYFTANIPSTYIDNSDAE